MSKRRMTAKYVRDYDGECLRMKATCDGRSNQA
jgi:hypothetical protein